ncbi:MAG TPA: tetratricopeptide repeat protein [Pyrinomonadaceae bacterium]|jgi:tetratricopeptide (TPR) repeat protein
MRDDKIISNGAGALSCRSLMRCVLECTTMLALSLVLCAVGVRAQSAGKRESSNGARKPATREQTRSRRVAAQESSQKKDKDNASPVAAQKATQAAVEEPAASNVELEDEPPPPVPDEANNTDKLTTLRAQIRDAKTDTERSRLRRTLVDYLVALKRQPEAIDELQRAMREERFDPVGFYNIGNALARLGDTTSAIEAYRKAIEQRRGYYSRALHNLGVLLMREGRWDEAQEALTGALRQEAYRYPEASYNLGRLYTLRGEAALAMREWHRVLALRPDHTDAALALARAYAEDGNPERAISVIDSFTARRGASNQLAAARREILYNAETYEASNNENFNSLTKTASASSSSAVRTNASVSAPNAARSNNNARPATSSSLRSLTVDRDTYDLLERARAAREDKREEEAVGFYNRVLARRGGFFPPANLELSFVLSSLNRHAEAIASLQKLIAKEGARYPIAYFHLGREYEALGQLNAAAEAYGRAATAYGDKEPQFLLDVSRVREKEGNIAAALNAMEEYARLSGQRGRTPEWTAGRIADLQRKKDAAASTTTPQAPATKP